MHRAYLRSRPAFRATAAPSTSAARAPLLAPLAPRWRSAWLVALVAASAGLGACGSSGGGLGIGFANTEARERSVTTPIRILRVYLPEPSEDAAAEPYVELWNDSGTDYDWAAAPLHLLSASGKANLPVSGSWPNDTAWRLQAEALAPLGLTARAGELLLADTGNDPVSYVSWGVPPAGLRTGLSAIARQADLAIFVAYPLPAPIEPAQALYFGGGGGETDLRCTDAKADARALQPAPCLPGGQDL